MSAQEKDGLGAMTVKEFCQRYSLSPVTFYKQVKSGRLRLTKCGRRSLILTRDVLEWECGLATMGAKS